MTIHHDPAELPRPALATRSRRPWSAGEIAMGLAAVTLVLLALALFYLSGGGR